MNNKTKKYKLGENKQNNNESKHQKIFNDIETNTNWLKIGKKNSKKKTKDNSIGV